MQSDSGMNLDSILLEVKTNIKFSKSVCFYNLELIAKPLIVKPEANFWSEIRSDQLCTVKEKNQRMESNISEDQQLLFAYVNSIKYYRNRAVYGTLLCIVCGVSGNGWANARGGLLFPEAPLQTHSVLNVISYLIE